MSTFLVGEEDLHAVVAAESDELVIGVIVGGKAFGGQVGSQHPLCGVAVEVLDAGWGRGYICWLGMNSVSPCISFKFVIKLIQILASLQ